MNSSLEVRRGNKAFAIVAAILFLFLAVIAFFSMIIAVINAIDYNHYVIVAYQIVNSLLGMSAYTILAIACFVRKKNVFAIVAASFPFVAWILGLFAFIFILEGRLSLGFSSLIYILNMLSLVALAILCCIPKIADKCKWTKFIGAVPGVLYFISLISDMMLFRNSVSTLIVDILFYVPAFVFFGLWLASPEKKQSAPVAQQCGYAPAMQYDAPVQGYYPQYTDANVPQYQNAPEYQNAPQYSAEQYNGYNQGQN